METFYAGATINGAPALLGPTLFKGEDGTSSRSMATTAGRSGFSAPGNVHPGAIWSSPAGENGRSSSLRRRQGLRSEGRGNLAWTFDTGRELRSSPF